MSVKDCESLVFALLTYALAYKLTTMSYVLLAENDYTALPMIVLSTFFIIIGICKDNINATVELKVIKHE